MVKLLGLLFTVLLVCAHGGEWGGRGYHRPLSMFRDVSPAWLGYALFATLLAIALAAARTAYRVHGPAHAMPYWIAMGLLAVVAVTPSLDAIHLACSLLAMATVFGYYAVLLYRADAIFWLLMHLLMPSLLMMATHLESYGIWQKGLILYFVAAVLVHQHLLSRELPRRTRKKRKRVRVVIGRQGPA